MTSPGSASPAEMQIRIDDRSGLASSIAWSCWAYIVGTPKKTVGRSASIASKVICGVGRRSLSPIVAPTQSGKVIALPKP